MQCKGDVRLLVIEGAHFRDLMHQYPDMSDRVISNAGTEVGGCRRLIDHAHWYDVFGELWWKYTHCYPVGRAAGAAGTPRSSVCPNHSLWRPDPANGVQLHTVLASQENEIHPATLYTDWPPGDFEAFISRILDVIDAEGLDVLHFHYAVPFAFLAAEVKRRLGRAAPLLVGTLHGTDVSDYGRDSVKGFRLAQALDELDELTTVSNSHAFLATELFGLSTHPL